MRVDDGSSTRDPLEELAEEFFARRRRGEQLSIEAFVAEHAGRADELRVWGRNCEGSEKFDSFPEKSILPQPHAVHLPSVTRPLRAFDKI